MKKTPTKTETAEPASATRVIVHKSIDDMVRNGGLAQEANAAAIEKVTSKMPVAILGTWDGARRWRDAAVAMEEGKLFCQVMMGFELIALRAAVGVEHGKKTDSSQLGKSADNWVELLEKELGISKTSAYRLMEMAEGAKPRLKALPELREFDPSTVAVSALPEETHAALTKAVKKLTDGATQVEFMRELGLAKQPQGAGAKGREKGEGGRPAAPGIGDQLAIRTELARDAFKRVGQILTDSGAAFVLLPDSETQAIESFLERQLAAVRKWNNTAPANRDARVIEEMLKG